MLYLQVLSDDKGHQKVFVAIFFPYFALNVFYSSASLYFMTHSLSPTWVPREFILPMFQFFSVHFLQ